MIIEAIFTIFLTPLNLVCGLLSYTFPSLVLPAEFFGGLVELVGYVGWLLPLSAILPVYVFMFGIMAFNLVWKIVLRVKSFIPAMGD